MLSSQRKKISRHSACNSLISTKTKGLSWHIVAHGLVDLEGHGMADLTYTKSGTSNLQTISSFKVNECNTLKQAKNLCLSFILTSPPVPVAQCVNLMKSILASSIWNNLSSISKLPYQENTNITYWFMNKSKKWTLVVTTSQILAYLCWKVKSFKQATWFCLKNGRKKLVFFLDRKSVV